VRDIVWLSPDGQELLQQEWQDEDVSSLSLALGSATQAGRLAIIFTRSGNIAEFALPKPQLGMVWEATLSGDKFASFIEIPAS
ncbi:MAG TPA: hypothetical protein VIJ49_07025, partial [Aestuariivirga sp.]